MYCQHCGQEISDTAKFCPGCGAQIYNSERFVAGVDFPQKGTFCFHREKSAVAKLFGTSVIIDGIKYGEVKENEELSVQMSYGTHQIALKTAANPTVKFSLMLTPENNRVYYPFKVNAMGKAIYCGTSGQAVFRQVSGGQERKKTKWWIWLIVAFLIIGAIGNAGKAGKSGSGATSSPKPVATPRATVTSTPAPTAVPVYAVGDTVSYDGLDFTVKKVIFSQSAGNLGNLNPSGADYRYCVVYVDVTNTTNEKKTLISPFLLSYTTDYSFRLLYDGEVEYTESFAEYTDFLFGNEEILPLATLTNKVLNFKVPVAIQSSDKSLELVFSFKSDEQAIWKLR